MRIGIDIDDVLTNTSEKLKEYLHKYEKSGDGNKYIVEILRGELPTQNIKKFMDTYINEMCENLKIKDDAIDVINGLINCGHEIIFITSRGEKKLPGTEKTTIEFLQNNDIKYTEIVFNSIEKQLDCKEKNIDIMVDDSIRNCELIRKEGIKTIVYTSEVNKNMLTEIERVDNWLELQDILQNFAMEKN